MKNVTMKTYKQEVEDKKQYFQKLQEDITKTQKIVSQISKKYYGGSECSIDEVKDNFNLSDWISEKIEDAQKNGVMPGVVCMYIYFDGTLANKYSGYNCTYFGRAFLRAMGYGIQKGTMAYLRNTNTYSPGLAFKGNYSKMKFEEDMTNTNTYNFHQMTPIEVINECKKSDSKYIDGYGYICANPEIFPKSVQTALRKRQKKKEERTELTSLENQFQYKMYLKTLPKKITPAFIKEEIRRLTQNMPLRNNELLTKMLIVNAVLETYDYEELMATKGFTDIIKNKIMHWQGAEDFTENEKRAVLSEKMQKAMTTVMFSKMGFSLETEFEKEIIKK